MLEKEFINTFYTNDNLFILNGLNGNLVDLIYLDPPFNTKKIFSAPIGSPAAGASFKDMWTWQDINEAYLETLAGNYPALARFIGTIGKIHSKGMMAYLTYMVQRIIEMHRVLKDTGSLYLHCDPTASHYLKILLDEIFGKNNFRNEIVWCYKGASEAKISFPNKHNIILFYAKSQLTNFNYDNIRVPYQSKSNKPAKWKDGEHIKHPKGTKCLDWFSDIPSFMTASQSKERTGFKTQKPLKLLERIIKASSNEGDIVMDPFCGCATTCVAAQHLGRKWIGIDIGDKIVDILVDRLTDATGAMFKDFIATGIVPQRTDVIYEPPSKSIKERLYKEQNGLCNGCGNSFDVWNLEVDHIIPKAKGGGDYYENYQLLCSSCNRTKGERPMEYLRMKIEVREKMLKDKIIFGE